MEAHNIIHRAIKYEKRENDHAGEKGMVMLEATYCILLTLFVLMFLLSLGFLLYQRTMFSVVANEVAEEAVMTYKLKNVSEADDVSVSDVTGVGKYRYLILEDSLINGLKFNAVVNTTTLATVRLQQTSLAQDEGSILVEIDVVKDDLGRRHYEVTLTQEYTILLGAFLEAIGIDGTPTLTATSVVSGVDALYYVNSVKTAIYISDEIQSYTMTGKLANTMISLVNTTIDLMKTIFGD